MASYASLFQKKPSLAPRNCLASISHCYNNCLLDNDKSDSINSKDKEGNKGYNGIFIARKEILQMSGYLSTELRSLRRLTSTNKSYSQFNSTIPKWQSHFEGCLNIISLHIAHTTGRTWLALLWQLLSRHWKEGSNNQLDLLYIQSQSNSPS